MVKKAERTPDYGQVRLFVYGTLKRGHANNVLLTNSGAKFLGYDFIPLNKSTFVTFGAFPAVIYPLITTKRNTHCIFGEIWYGTGEILKSCDILEGHPEFFRREKQRTKIFDRNCWVYTLPEDWIGEATDFLDEKSWKPVYEEETFWTNYEKYNKIGA